MWLCALQILPISRLKHEKPGARKCVYQVEREGEKKEGGGWAWQHTARGVREGMQLGWDADGRDVHTVIMNMSRPAWREHNRDNRAMAELTRVGRRDGTLASGMGGLDLNCPNWHG